MAEPESDPGIPTVERLLLLVRVGRIIASGRELAEVLQRTADAIHELLGYANVDLPLLDPRDPLTLRIEARQSGVRVSVLCPGVIRTPILSGGRFGRDGVMALRAAQRQANSHLRFGRRQTRVACAQSSRFHVVAGALHCP